MKLTSVTLTAFRSAVDLTIPLADRTLIVGANGAGKSSVRDAIRWALLGTAPGVDGKGSGADGLVPWGTSGPLATASARVDVEGLGPITRTWQPSGQTLAVAGVTGSLTVQQAAVSARLQTTEAVLAVLLDARAFLALHHAAAKTLLLSLLDVRIPYGGQPHTLDAIEALYQQAYRDRTSAKATLKAVVVPELVAGGPQPPLEAIEARLAEIGAEMDRLQQEIGQVRGRRDALSGQLAVADQRAREPGPTEQTLQNLRDAVQAAEERLAIIDADGPDAPPAPPAEDEAGLSVERLQAQAASLAAHRPTHGCVLDPEVPCETAAKVFTARLKVVRKALADATAAAPVLVPVEPDATGMVSPQAAAQEALHAAQRDLAQAEAQQQARIAARSDRDALAAQLASLPTVDDAETALADLRARRHKGEAMRDAVLARQRAASQREAALQRQATAQAEVTRLEQAVRDLGPTGVRVEVLTRELDRFLALANPILAPWGWTLAITVEPWAVTVNGHPAETYSASERYRIGVALQLAVAKLSGVSFAVIDELDLLDTPTRNALGRQIANAQLDQVIVLSTRDPSVPLSVPAGWAGYRLVKVDGRTAIEGRAVSEEVSA